MSLRLTTGAEYRADIATLRDQVRANGTRAVSLNIPVQIPNPPAGYGLSLVLNLAWEANGALASPNASLYTMGFINATATYLFNVVPMPWAVPPGARVLVPDGSYGSLGYNVTPLPAISAPNLRDAAITLANFAVAVPPGGGGVPVTPGDATCLVCLIVALSEAVRFNATEDAIANVLDNPLGPPFAANAQRPRYNGWNAGGHRIGA
ncbi:ribosome-inactivating family protein [Trinickia diaoshuihuensis]|uniref:ribosome-inactivating family protein n=1 Tax=Trinickia diaoshuihuensis TaxID=2292265 RepID=UPI000E2356FC|nr:ribosome-inactivating family protein [Trinickia diaoshuihuensis]